MTNDNGAPMENHQRGLSRRRFLGGSAAAAVGALAAGAPRWIEAQQTPQSVPPVPLSELSPKGPPDESYWWKVRSQFNVVDGMSFMNNGTLGPTSQAVMDEHERVMRAIAADPTDGYRTDDQHEIRQKWLAPFVGADPSEVAFTRSTTEGMNIFAHGLDLQEGDEVIMCNHEHPGGYEPYQIREMRDGIRVKWVEVPAPPESVDQLVSIYEDAITPRTRLIMVSHMTYVTGTVMPVKELADLAHRNDALISVDGAHPLGMIQLDFHDMGVDHYAAAGQKWLCSGTGTGLAYFRQGIQDRVWPLIGAGGSGGYQEEVSFTEDARKYEDTGQRDAPSAIAMAKAVELQETVGKENIENRVRQLATRLKNGLQEIDGVKLRTSMDPKLSAGLTLFSVGDVPMENVQQGIWNRERLYIRTMSTGDYNAVRASTHFYNMPGEVDRLLSAVRHIAANQSQYT